VGWEIVALSRGGVFRKKATVFRAWIAEHPGIKNESNRGRVIHRMDLSPLSEKDLGNLRRFVSEKMNTDP